MFAPRASPQGPRPVQKSKLSRKLTARQIASAKTGRHGDGGGLYLVVSRTGARKWIFRFTSSGKSNEMGVGGAAVTLAQARDRAADARKFVAAGVNPITARHPGFVDPCRIAVGS